MFDFFFFTSRLPFPFPPLIEHCVDIIYQGGHERVYMDIMFAACIAAVYLHGVIIEKIFSPFFLFFF